MSHKELTRMTVEACLKDAGLDKSAIQSVFFGNGLWGCTHDQHGIRGHLAMRYCGIDGIPITNVEAACATGTLALHCAWKDIQTGLYNCSLAVGVEKLICDDKRRSLAAFNSYIDAENTSSVFKTWDDWMEANVKIEVPEIPVKQRSPFMDLYGYMARWHMARFGTTVEQLAIAASKNHYHSTMNPKAQYQFPVSVEEVLNDIPVSWPLTRSMCSPLTDGAASAIVCSRQFLEQLPKEVQKRAVRLAATVYASGDNSDFDSPYNHVREAAKKAYEIAGLTPGDIDVAEVHDATIIGEIVQIENMGFCPIGEGGRFTESGATRLGGKIPVNTSGGMVSRGHPVSASGLAMIAELVTQLRGEAGARQVKGAKYALCENSGGMIKYKDAAVAITILAKD
ncbi:MAG: thiolase family protein [Oscillospiraceae bacterium]